VQVIFKVEVERKRMINMSRKGKGKNITEEM
jgi:hypothetical protein